MRVLVLGFFTISVIVYGIKEGVHGLSGSAFSPTGAIFLAIVPIILFNYVGFELGNGAAEEMVDPQRDVPKAVIRSAVIGIALYCVPVFGIIFVLPPEAITGLGGFIDAINQVFTVYGSAAHVLLILMTLGFIFALMTSGAVWMIGADRIQAVAAQDGAFFPFFGVFNTKLGTPVRVNLLSGVSATVFMVVAVNLLQSESAANAFIVVLTIAISTTLISYLWIFPAAIKLRTRYPEVHRPYRVPWGKAGLWLMAGLITFWVALGSFTSVFPSVLEKVFGIDYGDFRDVWGVSFGEFEVLTLGTLAIVVLVGTWGYFAGRKVRTQEVEVPLETEVEAASA
jgi:amino acid transporter